MAARSWNYAKILGSHPKGISKVVGRAVGGSTSITAVSGIDKGYSIARTATGAYAITFKDAFPYFQGIECHLEATTPANVSRYKAVPGALSSKVVTVYCYEEASVSAAAAGTITADSRTNTTDDDYFILNDGSQTYAVILSTTDGATLLVNGTDYVADQTIIVDISGVADTAAGSATAVFTAINASDIQMTAVDATGSVTLTQDNAGGQGNTQQSGYGTTSNAWAVTDMTGGTDVGNLALTDLAALEWLCFEATFING